MKRIPAIATVLLVVPCLTGCFTGLSRNTGAGSWGPSKTDTLVLGALDVVTLPFQAPFLVEHAVSSAKAKATQDALQKKRADTLLEIKKDPDYLFTQGPSLEKSMIRMALEDHAIPFTEAQLHRLAGTNNWTRPFVLANPRCPKELLEEAWNGLARLPDNVRSLEANYLASNPTIPDAWLEEMVRRPDIYRHTSIRAKEILGKRKRETGAPADKPPTAVQRVEAPVDRMNIHAHILKDPEYLFTHRHLLTKEKVCLLIADRKIPFTADQLRRLGGTNEWTRTYVASNWRCPPDLLEDIWHGLPMVPDAERPIAAANLISNPNVPIPWLVEIMKRRDLYGDATNRAAGAYYLRVRVPVPPPGSPPGAVPQPPGK